MVAVLPHFTLTTCATYLQRKNKIVNKQTCNEGKNNVHTFQQNERFKANHFYSLKSQ
jgi:hypothetical protein